MTAVVFALVATSLAGYALVRPLLRGVSAAERLAWSVAAGLVAQALLVLALVAARPGADFSLPLALLTALLMTPLLLKRPPADPEALRPLPVLMAARVLLGVCAAGVVLFGLSALSEPMWTIDYLAIWGFKAKTIFLTASVPGRLFHDSANAWSHPEYPLLLPLDLAALAGWARRWDDHALATLYPVCQAAAAVAAFGFLARRGRALGGAVAAVLVAWFFPLYARLHVGMADIPLALGIVLLASALLDSFESDSVAVQGRLATAAFLCAATKVEGTLLVGLACLFWLAARPHGRPWAPVFVALVVPPSAHSLLMRLVGGPTSARDFDFTLLAPARWGEWFGRIGEAASRIATVEVGAAAIPLCALAVFFLATRRGAADRVLPLLLAQVLCYVLACSLSAFGIAWLVETSFARLACTLFPALTIVLGSRAEQASQYPDGSTPGSRPM